MSKKNRMFKNKEMEFLDLNIDNYSTDDIFRLFHLTINQPLSQFHIQEAKRFVLSSHPDKSKLPSKYYCFFSEAFKILLDLFTFSEKTNQTEPIYNDILHELKGEESAKKGSSSSMAEFHAKFEREFSREEEDAVGYGSWLSDKTPVHESIQLERLNENVTFLKRREAKKKTEEEEQYFTKYDGAPRSFMQIVPRASTALMTGDSAGAGTYTADLFASIKYADLKYAYEENFLPEAAAREFETRPMFRTVEEYLKHREEQNQAYNRDAHLKLYTKFVTKIDDENTINPITYTKLVPK